MPTTRKKPSRKVRKSAKIQLTKAQRKRLADPTPFHFKKFDEMNEAIRKLEEQGDL
jgi:hypothetical protein